MDRDLEIKMYRDMLKIRLFEDKVNELVRKGELYGFYHLYTGQEAVAVGTCSALNRDDYITSTHRGHGHVIAKGLKLDRMMAELMGKVTGYNKAKGGSMHLASLEYGVLGANGIVGAGIPIATGAALSSKLQGNKRVAVCFFGDAASNQGSFHEAINIASAFNLPCIYMCENNLYGVGTRQSRVRKVENIADRAAAYAIPGKTIDGNDVMEVYCCVKEAVERAREGKGPTLIECRTYRWGTHHNAENDTYRPPEEVMEWKKKCPIKKFETVLLNEGILSPDEIVNIEKEIVRELDDAVEYGRNSKLPEIESALDDVLAE
jgi:acetoin:2,6-dichlorophenolindophenol oxidoreductase subunit alpha